MFTITENRWFGQNNPIPDHIRQDAFGRQERLQKKIAPNHLPGNNLFKQYMIKKHEFYMLREVNKKYP